MEKKKIEAEFLSEFISAEDSTESRSIYDKSRFGELKENKFLYSLPEALYLIEKKLMKIVIRKKELSKEAFFRKAKKVEPNFWVRYQTFKDLRTRGYIVKTALKFGADFRVYDKGIKPGQDHAKWIVFPVYEGNTLTWYDFAAKNRVAHSTKKKLLIAIVDDEGDVSYYEIDWKRP